MDIPMLHTDNNKQIANSKALMKTTRKQTEVAYPESISKGVEASLQQADKGKLNDYTGIKDLLEAK